MCKLAGAQVGEEGSVCFGTSLEAGQEGTGLPGEGLSCGTELAARGTGSCIPPEEQELKILNGNEAKCKMAKWEATTHPRQTLLGGN